jgi:hypothetical protein
MRRYSGNKLKRKTDMKFAVITINTVVTLLSSNDRASKSLFRQLWGVF